MLGIVFETAWAHHPGAAGGATNWLDLLTLAGAALGVWGLLRIIDRGGASRASRRPHGRKKP